MYSPAGAKIIIFFSGEAKDSVIFPFFILLHKRVREEVVIMAGRKEMF
jgi:hypothetical protein